MFFARKAQTHHRPQLLPYGRNTQAYWTKATQRSVVVFVHGFRGKSVTTWKAFQKLMPGPEAADADIIFYGYDGFGAHIVNSAVLLREFLEALLDRPNSIPLQPIVRSEFRYERVVLVAHSMGAIVLRRALLQFKRADHWADPIRLLFFCSRA